MHYLQVSKSEDTAEISSDPNSWIREMTRETLATDTLRAQLEQLLTRFGENLMPTNGLIRSNEFSTAICLDLIGKPINLQGQYVDEQGILRHEKIKKDSGLDANEFAIGVCMHVQNGHGSMSGNILVVKVLMKKVGGSGAFVLSIPLAAWEAPGSPVHVLGLQSLL